MSPGRPALPSVEIHSVTVAPATLAADHLTVVTANLLNPYGRLRRTNERRLAARLEAFARLVEEVEGDVVLCQEVGRSHNFRVDSWLSSRMGMGWVYVRANGDAEHAGREEGLAIFSRYPLSRPEATLLAGGLWRRPALGAVVASPLGEMAVYSVHLSLRPWRNQRQPAALRVWVEATAGQLPAIVGGDFNAGEKSPGIALLRSVWVDAFRHQHPAAEGATHDVQLWGWSLRRTRLDYLFIRQGEGHFRIENSEVRQSAGVNFSDHLAVVVRLAAAA